MRSIFARKPGNGATSRLGRRSLSPREPGEPVLGVGGVGDLTHLAIAHDVHPCRVLPRNDARDPPPHERIQILGIVRLLALLLQEQFGDIVRARQAADVSGEDTVCGKFHGSAPGKGEPDYSRAPIIAAWQKQQHIEVRIASSDSDMQGVFVVRHEVFIVEQGVPLELERDDTDDSAVHVVASDGTAIVGTARLTQDSEARIGRVAVLPAWRRRSIAAMLLAALESEARSLGISEVSLHSQTYVQALYERYGYAVTGPGFVEAGIDHVPMSKRLDQ